MLAGAHKKFYSIQHPEIYLLDRKIQYKHKVKFLYILHIFVQVPLPP